MLLRWAWACAAEPRRSSRGSHGPPAHGVGEDAAFRQGARGLSEDSGHLRAQWARVLPGSSERPRRSKRLTIDTPARLVGAFFFEPFGPRDRHLNCARSSCSDAGQVSQEESGTCVRIFPQVPRLAGTCRVALPERPPLAKLLSVTEGTVGACWWCQPRLVAGRANIVDSHPHSRSGSERSQARRRALCGTLRRRANQRRASLAQVETSPTPMQEGLIILPLHQRCRRLGGASNLSMNSNRVGAGGRITCAQ